MTVPITTPSECGLYEVLERLHGHRCPMSILGARMGLAARALLQKRVGFGVRFTARYFHRTCALDGIQLATGCTLGNRNIWVEPEGDHRLTLGVEDRPEAVTVRLTERALERGTQYSKLRQESDTLVPNSMEWQRVSAAMETILSELETARDADLVSWEQKDA